MENMENSFTNQFHINVRFLFNFKFMFGTVVVVPPSGATRNKEHNQVISLKLNLNSLIVKFTHLLRLIISKSLFSLDKLPQN